MAWFRNLYRCARCGEEWTDEWSAMCDDDCPHCGARHMSPVKSEDLGDDAVSLSKTDRIRVLNDNFRSTFVGGRVLTTASVAELPVGTKARLFLAVQSFSNFSNDNDPHGEHDFGSIEFEGETYFWKIDYYSPDLRGGSEDSADPAKTARVLTIMLASEY